MKSLIDEALSNLHIAQPMAPAQDARPMSEDEELRRIVDAIHVRISIVGCGGGGSNTINRLSKAGVFGADLIAANTDARHLIGVHASHKVLLGKMTTRGLGAGSIPEIGEKAAEESRDELAHLLEHSKIVFVTAGLGGGTGTGAAPVVAKLARNNNALTIGVVTMPFKAEGRVRMENARRGLEKLRQNSDAVAVIFNDRLLELVPRLPLNAAFRVADEVLMESIKGLTETITKPGLVNIDFNDVLTVMKDAGMALIGMGEGTSKDEASERMEKAVQRALDCPLLGNLDLSTAKGALIRVTGGEDMTVQEAEKAAELVSASISPRARLIWGCNVEPTMRGLVRVMVVLTGIENAQLFGPEDPKGPAIIDAIR
jgi:cell division protein FtsZ